MNILFLSAWFPIPADNGSKLRILNLLRILAERHRVQLIAAGEPSQSLGELAELCEQVQVVPWQPRPVQGWRRIASLAVARPEWTVVQADGAMSRAIEQQLAVGTDLVIASEMGTAVYARQFGGRPALLDDLEIGAYRPASGNSGLRRWRAALYWSKLRRAVRVLLRPFRACTVVSEVERDLVRAISPGLEWVEVVPNGVDTRGCAAVRAEAQPGTLVFSGSLLFPANHEAVTWFLREVWPLVRQQRPEAHLRITGKHGKLDLPLGVGDPSITLTGVLDDVRPVVASSWASVVPLRRGGGTRLKVLESMALGTPVVATSRAIEGLAVVPGEHALVADEPGTFAEQVVRLLADPDLRDRVAASARRLVQDKYDWGQVRPRFLELVERVARDD